AFLGVGVQPPTPPWGSMIASGRDTLVNAPWVAAAPGVALVLVVVACTLLGDALQDALDPATRSQTQRLPAYASEHGFVQFMPAIERDLFARDRVLTQAVHDARHHLRCDVLVRAAVHERQLRVAQPTDNRVVVEVEIGRELAAPQRETI